MQRSKQQRQSGIAAAALLLVAALAVLGGAGVHAGKYEKEDVARIGCSVCASVAEELFNAREEMGKTTVPKGSPPEEADILEYMESVCSADKEQGMWIGYLDITDTEGVKKAQEERSLEGEEGEDADEDVDFTGGEGPSVISRLFGSHKRDADADDGENRIAMTKYARPRRCGTECASIEVSCKALLLDGDEADADDVSAALWKHKRPLPEFQRYLCEDLSERCPADVTVEPAIASGFRDAWDEPFEPMGERDLEIQKLMAAMEGSGVSGNVMSPEALMGDGGMGGGDMFGYGADPYGYGGYGGYGGADPYGYGAGGDMADFGYGASEDGYGAYGGDPFGGLDNDAAAAAGGSGEEDEL